MTEINNQIKKNKVQANVRSVKDDTNVRKLPVPVNLYFT
jgi:hypothetical protein